MTEPSGTNMAQVSASEHAARYEALRHQALQWRCATVARDGLAVLLRSGVAAWMDACSRLPSPAAPPTQDEHQRLPLAEGTDAEVVRVLAAMAMEHFEEVRV